MKSPSPSATDPSIVDRQWMQRALEQAYAARAADEVPVGAVLVRDNRLIAEARNLPRTLNDPTAHAEILAIRAGTRMLGTSRLLDATLYVTLEPCAMCAGALVLAKLGRLVYAAPDPKTGMCGSLADIARDPRLNHRIDVASGVLADEAGEMLRQFFRARRRS